MAETGAVFGGEHSAHYYFLDNYRADSGIIATMFMLQELSRAKMPLSQLRQPFERYEASGEINTSVSDAQVVMAAVAEAYKAHPQDWVDGLTVDCGDWWFNLRPSNTEHGTRFCHHLFDVAMTHLGAHRDSAAFANNFRDRA